MRFEQLPAELIIHINQLKPLDGITFEEWLVDNKADLLKNIGTGRNYSANGHTYALTVGQVRLLLIGRIRALFPNESVKSIMRVLING